jgi:glycerol uptake facilitator-like aquaporin
MNPAVTVAMLVTRNVTLLRGVIYVLAQCLGGLAGAGILYGVTPSDVIGTLGVTQVHVNMGLGQAFGVEFMITFILVFTVFANMESKIMEMGSRSLAVGLAVTVGNLFAVG